MYMEDKLVGQYLWTLNYITPYYRMKQYWVRPNSMQ